jgi:hypothetical protein
MNTNHTAMPNNNPEGGGFIKNISSVYLKHINESKFVIGIAMILLNVGSKYVDFKFTKGQEQLLRDGIARELVIFTIVFMGTRDILYAILLTAAFKILSEHVFNENSPYCLVSDKFKKISALIDTNSDGHVTPEEEARALIVLKKAEKNRDHNMQHKFSTYLNNMNNNISSLDK